MPQIRNTTTEEYGADDEVKKFVNEYEDENAANETNVDLVNDIKSDLIKKDAERHDSEAKRDSRPIFQPYASNLSGPHQTEIFRPIMTGPHSPYATHENPYYSGRIWHPTRPHLMYPGPQYPPHYPNAMQVSSVDNTLRRQPGNITDDQRHAHMVAPPMKTSVICQTPMPGLPSQGNSSHENGHMQKKWHQLDRAEQAKYYDQARRERALHMQLYPGWSARENYAQQGKKKKRKRDKSQGDSSEANNPKKCRARYGLDRQQEWCKPCSLKEHHKIRLLMVHLDESDCFNAWLSYGDAPDVTPKIIDGKPAITITNYVNYGMLLLQALFEHWPETHVLPETDKETTEHPVNETDASASDVDINVETPARIVPGNGCFSIPAHSPVVVSESCGTGRTLLRFLAIDASGETERCLLSEIIPPWIYDVVVKKLTPKSNKLAFFLLPHSSSLKSQKRDRLCASDMIQIKKVIEHVYEKFFGSESSGTNSTPGNEREPSTVESEDISQIAHSKIELYCNDQLLEPSMDLRTVKHYLWKNSGEIVLHYKLLK
ncbi:Hypothetical predicted protein [Paramuricea clavata]|uniref:Uncharacterized protein n=1 Tax=Paramuricea clavata TaxID=317549 RepID=A0A6S7GF96_PARCT|nr:Hypothetical predicted protein [Paramuricea clavata]